MSDNKTNVSQQGRSRVSAEEGDEVCFAKKHSVADEQALKLIQEHCSNKKSLDAAAKQLKS